MSLEWLLQAITTDGFLSTEGATWEPFEGAQEGRCRRYPTRVFFPKLKPGISASYQAEKYAQAKAICAKCPVSEACLSYALDRPEYYGVWGGLTPHERGVHRRRRVS